MFQTYMDNTCIMWIVLFLTVFGTCQGISYDNPDCIVDKNLEPSATGNYMDCQSPEMVAHDKTECCSIDGAVGCCKPNGNWEKMKLIGIGIGVTTTVLALMCIYCFWCRKNPHVAKVEVFMKGRYRRIQESCTCLACCRRQVAERKKQEVLEQKAKEVPALDLPAESGTDDTTFDTFWRGPMVKT